MSRFLALDYGEERVGVALSDESSNLASPQAAVPLKPFRKFIGSLKRIIRENEVVAIVVGIPRNMDGSYGPSAESAQDFANRLKETIAIPIECFDERLTTVQASRALHQGGRTAREQKGLIDSASAQIILQTYLDHLAFKDKATG